jgi:hypothetical protein
VPSCEQCASWIYDDDWQRKKDAAGNDMPRFQGMATPCSSCPKVVASAEQKRTLHFLQLRSMAVELNDRNRQAYKHYLECRAVGQFPDDAVVRQNAVIIRAEVDWAEQRKQQEPLQLLVALLSKK